MRRYTVLLYPEEGKYTAVIPAFGDLATYGDTVEHALAMAKDVIEVASRGLVEDGEDVPIEETPPMVVTIEAAVPEPATA